MTNLQFIEINPEKMATATVIWLHGLGADGHDFEPIVPELNLPKSLAVRFIFPHAPHIPVTINGGFVMSAWYDIVSMEIERKVDVKQLEKSAVLVQQLITREIERGIASDKIIIAGFSQGGAVAYQAALSFAKPLAGVLALSTYFATEQSIAYQEANKNVPIMIMHGSQDPVVSEVLGIRAQQSLINKGFSVDYKRYNMQHSVCPQQIVDIGNWLTKVLTKESC